MKRLSMQKELEIQKVHDLRDMCIKSTFHILNVCKVRSYI